VKAQMIKRYIRPGPSAGLGRRVAVGAAAVLALGVGVAGLFWHMGRPVPLHEISVALPLRNIGG
jgi:hypothetical protein